MGCQKPPDAINLDAETLNWANALMISRFSDVLAFNPPVATMFSVLHLIVQWTRVHVGKNLKSAEFLFTCGLF